METGTHHPEPFRSGTSQTEEVKEKGRELTRTARERALSAVDQGKEQLSGVLERAADSMEGDRLGGYLADYARRAAELLRQRSGDELIHSARRSLRSRPGLVLGASFIAGLALARLVKGAATETGEGRYGERRFGGERRGERGDGGREYAESGYGESEYREPWAGRSTAPGDDTWREGQQP